jgi:hypothetical protein
VNLTQCEFIEEPLYYLEYTQYLCLKCCINARPEDSIVSITKKKKQNFFKKPPTTQKKTNKKKKKKKKKKKAG